MSNQLESLSRRAIPSSPGRQVSSSGVKKIIVLIIASLVIAAVNMWVWQLTEMNDLQLAWVAFGLVWLNLILSWITERRQPTIAYFCLSTSLIIEAILIVNYFWMQKGSRFL
jgi:hypothetical protein